MVVAGLRCARGSGCELPSLSATLLELEAIKSSKLQRRITRWSFSVMATVPEGCVFVLRNKVEASSAR